MQGIIFATLITTVSTIITSSITGYFSWKNISSTLEHEHEIKALELKRKYFLEYYESTNKPFK